MKIRLRLATAALLCAPLFAAASGDDPELLGVVFAPDTLDVSSSDATVDLTLTITDPDSGVDEIEVDLQSPSGDDTLEIEFDIGGLGQGVAYSATQTMVFPANSSIGDWRITKIEIKDVDNNKTELDEADLIALGIDNRLTVGPDQALGNAALVAIEEIKFKKESFLESGDAFVNSADDGEMELDKDVMTAAGTLISADTIKLKKDVVVAGDIAYNDLDMDNGAVILGSQTTPLSLPIVPRLPRFESALPGETDVDADDIVVELPAGSYGELKTDKDGYVVLLGGTYVFDKVEIKKETSLLTRAPSTVLIANELSIKKEVIVGPESGSGLSASDLVFYVADDEDVQIEKDSFIEANVYAPNSKLNFDKGVQATGAFIAREIELSDNVVVNVDSAFVNQAPIANDASGTADEGGSVILTLSGSDNEGDPLTPAIDTPPTNGTLGNITIIDGTTASVEYTHDGSETTSDSFTYIQNDGVLDSDPATVSITVNPVNDAPVAADGSATVDEGGTTSIALAASDVDSGTLSFTIVSGPSNGSLTETAPGVYDYAHDGSETTADSFTFLANDGAADSNIATVSITVNPVNDAPVAADGSATVDEGGTTSITLAASDVDSGTLSFTIVSGPSNGSLTETAPGVYDYTHDGSETTADSFTFLANDGSDDSNVATVSITVNPVNDAPVVDDVAATGTEDTALDITLTGSDVDSTALTFSIEAGDEPVNGSAAIATAGPLSATLSYIPDANYNGADALTVTACDDGIPQACDTATVAITLAPVSDAPIGGTIVLNVNPLTDTDFTVTSADADGDSVTFSLQTPPTLGSVAGPNNPTSNAAEFTYTAPGPATLSATDDFEVLATDSTGETALITIAVNIDPDVDPGTGDSEIEALSQELGTDAETPLTITLEGTDSLRGMLAFAITSGPTGGSVTTPAPLTDTSAEVVYTPDAGTTEDEFTFSVTNANGDSATGVITIVVEDEGSDDSGGNDQLPPTTADVEVTATQFNPAFPPSAGILLTASDNIGDPVTFTISLPAGGLNGVLSGPTGEVSDGDSFTGNPFELNLSFVANEGFSGTTSFDFVVSNAVGSDSGTVTIIVPTEETAMATDAVVTLSNNAPVTIVLTGTDALDTGFPQNNTLNFAIVTPPTSGTLSAITVTGDRSASVVYTPNSGFFGEDNFTFSVTDDKDPAETDIGTILIVSLNNGRP